MPININIDKTLEQVNQYGLANVLVVILIIVFILVFFFMLRWVVGMHKTMALNSHEEKMALASLVNVGLKSVTDSLVSNTMLCQQIATNLKDGFDAMRRADEFHRTDLKEIRDLVLVGHEKAEAGRERIIGAIQSNECQAEK